MLRSRYALLSLTWLSIGIVLIGCGENSAPLTDRADPSFSMPSSSTPNESKRLPYRQEMPRDAEAEEIPLQPAAGAALLADQGHGPGEGGDKYAHLPESGFVAVHDQPLSTFSLDVDTASYSKSRMYLLQQNRLPPRDAVRIEEFLNYFEYEYAPAADGEPFSLNVEVAECPWRPEHRLARVAIKGREIQQERPPCNLVFLIDVSGSMASPEKIGLVKQSLRLLTSQLTERDRVSIVVYASQEGLVLPATEGDHHADILGALERLDAGGSTNGGAGIHLAYRVAKQQHIANGVNRVILCTDGDFNVGVTSTGDLVRLAESEAKAGAYLTVLGFGMGNHNDAMLEEISNKANGAYAFIDNDAEARKVFLDQINSTLVTIARDVKIQVEFNPAQVAAYRLIGYENRLLQAHEFNDDRKDAGEVGAGHTVTALYELVSAGSEETVTIGKVDPLKYQAPAQPVAAGHGDELLTLKLRYKEPEADRSQLLTRSVRSSDTRFSRASTDFRFAACVAAFGMLLRQSDQAGDVNFDSVLEMASAARGIDPRGYRSEFLRMVEAARRLSPQGRTSAYPSPRPARHSVAPRHAATYAVAMMPPSSVPSTCGLPYVSIGIMAFMALNAAASLAILAVIGLCALLGRPSPKHSHRLAER